MGGSRLVLVKIVLFHIQGRDRSLIDKMPKVIKYFNSHYSDHSKEVYNDFYLKGVSKKLSKTSGGLVYWSDIFLSQCMDRQA